LNEPVPYTPEFSVLVAAHNASATIRATLDSLIAQTDRDWQACIVDDGSSDDTYAIACGYAQADPRLVVSRQDNAGSGAARNAAARLATGEYLCILDADDAYKPDYLASQRAFRTAHPGFDIYSCNADAVFPSGKVAPYDPERYPRDVRSFALEDMLEMNRIMSAAMVRSAAFRSVGGFREGVYVEDYDLWLRLLAHGATHVHNPESLVLYAVRSDGKTSHPRAALSSEAEVFGNLLTLEQVGSDLHRTIRQHLRDLEVELRRIDGRSRWRTLGQRLRAGDLTSARSLYWAARGAPVSRPAYYLGLALVLVSPAALAAVMRSRRSAPDRGASR
jgi:glycosyltransferase involved in cell wall biosynthesis